MMDDVGNLNGSGACSEGPLPRDERGAELVEFALIATLLITLILGLIDFGWAYSQSLSVKHAAREGARLATVDAGTDCGNLLSLITARVSSELTAGSMGISLTATTGAVGDTGTITVTYPKRSLTGFTTALNGGTLSSTVQFRMEQVSNWGQTCHT